MTDTSRYGKAQAAAWDRMHPKLARRCAWLDHDSDLPVVEGTVIRLEVQRLPGDRDPDPVWPGRVVTRSTMSAAISGNCRSGQGRRVG